MSPIWSEKIMAKLDLDENLMENKRLNILMPFVLFPLSWLLQLSNEHFAERFRSCLPSALQLK